MSVVYTSKMGLKITLTDQAVQEAEAVCYKGHFLLLKLLWAYVRCQVWLCWKGMVAGQRMLTAHDIKGRVVLLMAVTGTTTDFTAHRVFWSRLDSD